MATEFDKIAGYKEEKNELIKVCSLIKKMDELKAVGGKLPRGLFLIGPNGVGKTVLAESFIKESGVNSVTISYNDIEDDDQFTTYIKEKFQEASENLPCILFIDELDKMIGSSSRFFIENNFDRSRVLLTEINKYSKVEGLFLLIVANKVYQLDNSIIRSGRIDNIIEINHPNEEERLAIIEYYCKGKNIDADVNKKELAKLIKGFTGADIETLLNNAVIKSFSDNRKSISKEDITSVYYDKIFSCKSKKSNLEDESRKALAYHEAGHAVAALLLDCNSVQYASILSRNNVRGFVKQSKSEQILTSLESEVDKIKIALAGRASEELFLKKVYTGSLSDIQTASEIAAELVRHHGYCGFDHLNIPLSFDELMPPAEVVSDSKLERIEERESNILDTCYFMVKALLQGNKKLVSDVAQALLDRETLNREELLELQNQHKKQ